MLGNFWRKVLFDVFNDEEFVDIICIWFFVFVFVVFKVIGIFNLVKYIVLQFEIFVNGLFDVFVYVGCQFFIWDLFKWCIRIFCLGF